MTEYILADPTGNITALIPSHTEPADRVRMAESLMMLSADAPDFPTGPVEQVGYVTVKDRDTIRLDMAGGEFCGNASLSAAAYLASLSDSGIIPEHSVTVIASGAPAPLSVRIKESADAGLSAGGIRKFHGTIEMPSPLSFTEYHGLPVVNFSGISHMIAAPGSFTREEAEKSIGGIAAELQVSALGLLLYDRSSGFMEPLVYVRDSGTLVWEHGCASGSAAIGAFLYHTDKKNTAADIAQPGGIIKIRIQEGKILLSGQILLYLPRKL